MFLEGDAINFELLSHLRANVCAIGLWDPPLVIVFLYRAFEMEQRAVGSKCTAR